MWAASLGGLTADTLTLWGGPPPFHTTSPLADSPPYPIMSVRTIIQHDRAQLDDRLQAATNGYLTVEVYKTATFAFRAVVIGAIIAPQFIAGVEPLNATALLVLAALALGPDVAEGILT